MCIIKIRLINSSNVIVFIAVVNYMRNCCRGGHHHWHSLVIRLLRRRLQRCGSRRVDELWQWNLVLWGEFLYHRPSMVVEGVCMVDQHCYRGGCWWWRYVMLLMMHCTPWGSYCHVSHFFCWSASVVYQPVYNFTSLHMHWVLTTTIGVSTLWSKWCVSAAQSRVCCL